MDPWIASMWKLSIQGPRLNGRLLPTLEYITDLGVTWTDLDLVVDCPREVLIHMNSSGPG